MKDGHHTGFPITPIYKPIHDLEVADIYIKLEENVKVPSKDIMLTRTPVILVSLRIVEVQLFTVLPHYPLKAVRTKS